MRIAPRRLAGTFEIALEPRGDERGYFMRWYDREAFARAGLPVDWRQGNESASRANVVRGLHFQRPTHSETKLVRAIAGAVFDVFVDLRNCTYHNLALFFDRVGRFSRNINIENLKIAALPNSLKDDGVMLGHGTNKGFGWFIHVDQGSRTMNGDALLQRAIDILKKVDPTGRLPHSDARDALIEQSLRFAKCTTTTGNVLMH